MKLTKTTTIAAVIAGSLLVAALAVRAQDATTANSAPSAPATNAPAPTVHAHPSGLDMLAKRLNLTDEQTPKFKQVMQDMQQQMRDLRKDTSVAAADKRAKLMEIHDAASAKLKDILTSEQFAKWQKTVQGPRPMPQPSTNAPAVAPQQ